jgi:nucleoside-diphosphate-sugar epimerase
MKVLFIGGTGVISSACSKLALAKGYELFHLNRGKTAEIRPVEGVTKLIADARKKEEVEKIIGSHHFDVVVDWIAFDPAHIQQDLELFKGKTDQFIFISTASAYQKPPQKLPVTEDTPLYNPYWEYSRKKIACENMLMEEHQRSGFPCTIVRPSHTYDKTKVPLLCGHTALDRMRKGLPVIVHGEGTSLWTLTHHEDFARGFVGLFGKEEAIGEALHITSDECLSWNNIYNTFADLLGVNAELVYLPSAQIAKYDQDLGDGLLGDKMHSMLFDNTKVKSIVSDFTCNIPFVKGAKEIIQWSTQNKRASWIDNKLNDLMDKMIADHV